MPLTCLKHPMESAISMIHKKNAVPGIVCILIYASVFALRSALDASALRFPGGFPETAAGPFANFSAGSMLVYVPASVLFGVLSSCLFYLVSSRGFQSGLTLGQCVCITGASQLGQSLFILLSLPFAYASPWRTILSGAGAYTAVVVTTLCYISVTSLSPGKKFYSLMCCHAVSLALMNVYERLVYYSNQLPYPG